MKRTLLILSLFVCALANAAEVPVATNLGADGERARAAGQPVVVLFTASYCAWCTAVKRNYFRHLDSDPRYASRIIVREVVIDSNDALTDFDGHAATHDGFAGANGVSLVPTVRFFDGSGAQVADPLVGVSNMDFYGWYLDQRITRAMERAGPTPFANREPG